MSSVHGTWLPGDRPPDPGRGAIVSALEDLATPLLVVDTASGPAVAPGGRLDPEASGGHRTLAYVPALPASNLGDRGVQETYGVRVNYMAGAMANGIASPQLVVAMARAGMIGFFGAAGLSIPRIASALDEISAAARGLPWGANLIANPSDPAREQATVALYLARRVPAVSASAFVALTPALVQLRATGVHEIGGRIRSPTRILAKVSRPEVAACFLRPPPVAFLDALVAARRLTPTEAALAARIPMADDVTAEADSGGHTDNRPLTVLLPLLQALRDRIRDEVGYPDAIRIGAAGGLGCPEACAAAFALGAAYVLIGSVHQGCVEAQTSDVVRQMLATASMADVTMAPSSDMFEAGVQVQVLRRGTLFPQRAALLYRLYRTHDALDAIPPEDRRHLETQVLGQSVEAVWEACRGFFAERDPDQIARAEADPKHRMALVFRWYLGRSSRWAIDGDLARRSDLQIWCGPAMGAFNDWTRDSFLSDPAHRRVATVGANLMAGAAFCMRLGWLRAQGIDVGPTRWRPRPLAPPPATAAHRGSDARR